MNLRLKDLDCRIKELIKANPSESDGVKYNLGDRSCGILYREQRLFPEAYPGKSNASSGVEIRLYSERFDRISPHPTVIRFGVKSFDLTAPSVSIPVASHR